MGEEKRSPAPNLVVVVILGCCALVILKVALSQFAEWLDSLLPMQRNAIWLGALGAAGLIVTMWLGMAASDNHRDVSLAQTHMEVTGLKAGLWISVFAVGAAVSLWLIAPWFNAFQDGFRF